MHKHYHSQVTYVESGEFEMTIDEVVKQSREVILSTFHHGNARLCMH